MDEVLKAVVTGAPTFLGLVALAYVLNSQNNKYLEVVLKMLNECVKTQTELQALRDAIRRMALSAKVDSQDATD